MRDDWKTDAMDLLKTYGMSYVLKPFAEIVLLFVAWNLVAVPFELPYLTALGSIGLWLLARLLLPRILNVCYTCSDHSPET